MCLLGPQTDMSLAFTIFGEVFTNAYASYNIWNILSEMFTFGVAYFLLYILLC